MDGLELTAVTVAALGGASPRGGRGVAARWPGRRRAVAGASPRGGRGVFGTVLAIVAPGFLANGMNGLNINAFGRNVAPGTLPLIAVAAQRRHRKKRPIGIPD